MVPTFRNLCTSILLMCYKNCSLMHIEKLSFNLLKYQSYRRKEKSLTSLIKAQRSLSSFMFWKLLQESVLFRHRGVRISFGFHWCNSRDNFVWSFIFGKFFKMVIDNNILGLAEWNPTIRFIPYFFFSNKAHVLLKKKKKREFDNFYLSTMQYKLFI